jgi:hypothetical protein
MNSSNNNNTKSKTTFRIVGVLLVLCGMITTSFGFTLKSVDQFSWLVKPKMKSNEKLLQTYSRLKHKDPMLPALMHGLKRYMSGAQNVNKFDAVIRDNIRKFQVDRKTIESMLKNWDALDLQLKQRWFPKELIDLDAKKALDLNMFAKSVMSAAGKYASSVKGIPLPRRLRPGIVQPPQITEVRTAGLDFVLVLRPGGEFTLIGRNFSAVAAENRIQIGRVGSGTGVVELEVLHELTPMSATTTQLRGIAPRTIVPGDYNVRIITNRSRSNLWPAYVDTPPAPAARLDSVMPSACQFPGQVVMLRGENFAPDAVIQLEFIDADVIGADDIRAGYRDVRVGRPMVDFRNRNEIFFTIPHETWPGDYSISVTNPGAPTSLRALFTVCTPSYRVELDSIFCRDESDWESPGDDEIMIHAYGNADDGAFEDNQRTPEFEDFEDGTRRRFAGINLFSNHGAHVPVKHSMIFSHLVMESDDYSRSTGVLLASFLGGIAEGIAAIVGAAIGATAVAIGAVTGGIAIIVGLVVIAILLDPSAPDSIGIGWDRFTAQDLQLRTATGGASRSFLRTTSYLNDDDDGSYDVTYRVVRSRE